MVVEHQHQDGQLAIACQRQCRHRRVVEKGTIADQAHHRTFRCCQLDAQPHAQTLPQATGHADETVRPAKLDIAVVQAALRGGFIQVDGVRRQHFGQGGADIDGAQCRIAARVGNRLGTHRCGLGMRQGVVIATLRDGCGIRLQGVDRPAQLTQRCRHIAFEILIAMQHLMHHPGLERLLVQYHHPRITRTARGRIPRGAIAHQQHQVGIVQPGLDIKALMQGVVLGKVGDRGDRTFDHRNGQALGQCQQGFIAGDIAPGRFGNDHRIARCHQGCRQPRDGLGRRVRQRRARHRADACRQTAGRHQGFDRHIEISRAGGCAQRQFASAYRHVIQRGRTGGLIGPFHQRFQPALRAASHAEKAVPLRAGIERRIITVSE